MPAARGIGELEDIRLAVHQRDRRRRKREARQRDRDFGFALGGDCRRRRGQSRERSCERQRDTEGLEHGNLLSPNAHLIPRAAGRQHRVSRPDCRPWRRLIRRAHACHGRPHRRDGCIGRSTRVRTRTR